MLERLKLALVTSYVGAIALGYVFAQAVLHCAGIFGTPLARWLTRPEFPGQVAFTFSMKDGLPELARCVSLLLLGFVLLRWLYFTPVVPQTTEPTERTSGEA
jgi:ABC-type sulfate transport system permease component